MLSSLYRNWISLLLRNLKFFVAFLLLPLGAAEKHDRFVVVTPPKSGTHLLTKALEKLTKRKCHSNFSTYELSFDEWNREIHNAEREDAFVQMHALPHLNQIKSLKALRHKVIFLIRDPRDQAVSLLHFIEDRKWSFGTLGLEHVPYKNLSMDDKLLEIISGKKTGCSGVKGLFNNYLPWMDQPAPFVLTIRFEDLVGREGGGTRQRQVAAVRKMAKFLNMELSLQEIDKRSLDLFGKPGEKTFRKGKIGEWRTHFKPLHCYLMNRLFGAEMIKAGYVNDEEIKKNFLPKKPTK